MANPCPESGRTWRAALLATELTRDTRLLWGLRVSPGQAELPALLCAVAAAADLDIRGADLHGPVPGGPGTLLDRARVRGEAQRDSVGDNGRAALGELRGGGTGVPAARGGQLHRERPVPQAGRPELAAVGHRAAARAAGGRELPGVGPVLAIAESGAPAGNADGLDVDRDGAFQRRREGGRGQGRGRRGRGPPPLRPPP